MTAVSSSRRRATQLDLRVILLVVLAATILKYQGRSSTLLNNSDVLPYYVGATHFLQTGQVQERGDKSTYSSYQPPGTFYLVLAGVQLIKDQRLQELPGIFVQNLASLAFLYLIAKSLRNRGIAVASVVAVGLSQLGYLGVWPIGHPGYVLGALYFLLLWARARRAWALPVALGILAFGLSVNLAITPAVFVIPVLWVALSAANWSARDLAGCARVLADLVLASSI